MKSSELKRLLRKNGCFLVRQGTSHEIWESAITGERFSIPRHGAQEIRTGTLEAIKKQELTLKLRKASKPDLLCSMATKQLSIIVQMVLKFV